MKELLKTFWVVWNPDGRAPMFKHHNRESAETEAERLAKLNRGYSFIVLQSVSARCVDNMRRIDFDVDADIPF